MELCGIGAGLKTRGHADTPNIGSKWQKAHIIKNNNLFKDSKHRDTKEELLLATIPAVPGTTGIVVRTPRSGD